MRTVDTIRKRYRDQGVEGLRRGHPPGRTSAADSDFLKVPRKVVETPPQDLGYGFNDWSVDRLVQHVWEVTGAKFSASQLRRILKAEGYFVSTPEARDERET